VNICVNITPVFGDIEVFSDLCLFYFFLSWEWYTSIIFTSFITSMKIFLSRCNFMCCVLCDFCPYYATFRSFNNVFNFYDFVQLSSLHISRPIIVFFKFNLSANQSQVLSGNKLLHPYYFFYKRYIPKSITMTSK